MIKLFYYLNFEFVGIVYEVFLIIAYLLVKTLKLIFILLK